MQGEASAKAAGAKLPGSDLGFQMLISNWVPFDVGLYSDLTGYYSIFDSLISH